MPQPAEVQQIADELIAEYQTVADIITRAQAELAANPARRRALVARLRTDVNRALDGSDNQMRAWIVDRFPNIYLLGATSSAETLGTVVDPFALVHQAALKRMMSGLSRDLLAATKHVRRDVKRFVRESAQIVAEGKLSEGETAVQAGKRLARLLEDRGIRGITYKDGSRHSIDDYADVVIRSETAVAYNRGTTNSARDAGIEYMECFDNPDCIMPGQRFMPYGALTYLVRSWFDGPAVRVSLAGSDALTVGPHHPVLTRRGWVAAGLLNESDELIHDRRAQDPLLVSELDLQQMPFVEDVFRALAREGGSFPTGRTRHDLHGDAVFGQGEIEVVAPAWELLLELDPERTKHRNELALMRPDVALPQISRDGGSFDSLVGTLDSSVGLVRRGVLVSALIRRSSRPLVTDAARDTAELATVGPLVRSRERHPTERAGSVDHAAPARQQTRVAAEPALRVVLGVKGVPARLADRRLGRSAVDLAHAQSSFVRIERIERIEYRGWVYDATCSEHMFAVNGFTVKNCGLDGHDDLEKPNGVIYRIEIAEENPISHPRCVRSWGPVPFVDAANVADVSSSQSAASMADQAAFSRERATARPSRQPRTPRTPRAARA